MHRQIHRLAIVGTVATAACADPPVTPELASDDFALEACVVPGVRGPTQCGRYVVFEDRERQDGRRIGINVLVARATETPSAADPVVYFQGGPGGSSVSVAPGLDPLLDGMRRGRDIVYVDQRGTGGSNPLACNFPLPGGEVSLFGTLFPPDHITRCAAHLSPTADLSQYATPTAVDDIAEVLRSLGYDRVNLFGTSYGTRVALVFLRRHQSMVRSVILNGVAPQSVNVHLHDAANVDAALESLLRSCETSAGCRDRHPTLRDQLAELVADISDASVATRATLSDGSTVPVHLSRGDFGYAIRGMLYGALADSIGPWVEVTATTGDWSRFATYYVERSRWVASNFATGMHLSVFCTEDTPFATVADAVSASQGTVLGATLYERYWNACQLWPRGELPAGYHDPVRSDRPVLIVSGERDPATPAAWGDLVADTFTNSAHLVAPGAGHVPLAPCVIAAKERFVASASVTGLATACGG